MAPSVQLFVVTFLVAVVTCQAQQQETGGLSERCEPHDSYACVPYFQCGPDGVIVSDGAGLIDVRIRPQSTCYNNEFPEVPAICCLIPGATPVTIEECLVPSECVDPYLCDAKGEIIIDGGGLIDIRVGHSQCYTPNSELGVCCLPPKPPVLDYCPPGSSCVANHECLGQALSPADQFIDYIVHETWQECHLQHGNVGLCCRQPILELCPSLSICVEHGQCSGTALNPQNAFVDYVQQDLWQECNGGAYQGVCCKSNIIDQCPGSVCVEYGTCEGTAMDLHGSFAEYDPFANWSECNLGDGYTDTGVCCISKIIELPVAGKCGVRNYHIDQRIQSNYANNEAAFGEFPWQSIIFFQNFTFKCGASLISNHHAITAAHCVDGLHAGDIRLRFGEWEVHTFEEPLPYEDRNVHKIHIHPQYNPRNVHNDIAVLELIEPIPLSYHINTICLPSPHEQFYDGQDCFATGWGKDSFQGTFQTILKKINLPYVEHDRCQNLLRKTRLGRFFRLDQSFSCAGGLANEDACYGDGGGPLVCKNPITGQYSLAGITSWGIGCGTEHVPGVYVNVGKFSQWVDEIVHNQNQHFGPATNYGK